MSETVTVRMLDDRGQLKYSWDAALLAHEQSENLIVLYGDWERSLDYAPRDETVPVTNRTIEFYWLDRPYTVSVAYDQDWTLREYIGRTIRPPEFNEDEMALALVMLGFEIQVKPDYDYDLFEQDEASPSSDDDRKWAQRGLLELFELVERREGPFDPAYVAPYERRARRLYP